MRLHMKLILGLLAGLVVVIIPVQGWQYYNTMGIISSLSRTNIKLLQQKEEEAAKNIFRSVERAVAGSLERGEMEKFTRLLEAQNEIDGLLEFSLYDRHGKVTHSSGAAFLGKQLPAEMQQRFKENPGELLPPVWSEEAIEIFKPEVVTADCIRCHTDWKLNENGGTLHFRFSTAALRKANLEAEKTLTEMKRSTIVGSVAAIAGIIVVLLVVILVLVNRFVRRPIQQTVLMLRDIAEGEGDLTRRLEVASKDEVGELSKWFNIFMDKLQQVVKGLVGDIQNLTQASAKLASIAEEMAVKSAQMHQSSHDAATTTEQIAANIKNMASAAEEVSSQAAVVASSSREVSNNMTHVGDAAANVSNSVNTVATAIEEMYATLNEVAKNSGRGAQVTGEASEKASHTSDIVNKLGAAAKEIGDVVELIKGIAAQTNLLALNATIEAAGAGDAGKGFAVVANEVKELARQTAGATEEIREKVEGMQANTSAAVQAIENIVHVIEEINSIMGTIASAVEEQTATTNEISKSISGTASAADSVSTNVQTVAKLGVDVDKNIGEVAEAAVAIAKDAAEASTGTNRVSENVNGLNEAVEMTTQGVAQVKAEAEALADLAASIQTMVSQFKI